MTLSALYWGLLLFVYGCLKDMIMKLFLFCSVCFIVFVSLVLYSLVLYVLLSLYSAVSLQAFQEKMVVCRNMYNCC